MVKCNTKYICAGAETYFEELESIEKIAGKENFKQVLKHLKYWLITYGISIRKSRKDYTSYDNDFNERFTKMFNKLKSYNEIFNLYIDSGGYQASVGLLNPKYFEPYIESYKRWLINNKDKIHRAFTLDVIFGQFDETIDKFINYNTYGLHELFIPELQNVILPVFHFITPELFYIFTNIFFTDTNIYIKDKFSLGGLIAFDRYEGKVVHIPYAPVILFIFEKYKEYKGNYPKNIEIHLLGLSSFRDVVFITFLKRLFKVFYNIDITFTHDSAKTFRVGMRQKQFEYFDMKNMKFYELCYQSKYLNKKVNINGFKGTLENFILHILRQDLNVSIERFYDHENNKFIYHAEHLVQLLSFYQYNKIYSVLEKYLNDDDPEIILKKSISFLINIFGVKNMQTLNLLSNTYKLFKSKPDIKTLEHIITDMYKTAKRLEYLKQKV